MKKITKKLQLRVIKAFLDLLILAKLGNCSFIGGYDLIKLIHQKYGVLISPGSVYSNLYSLEREGLINGHQTEKGRVYKITDKGKHKINTVIKHEMTIQRFFGSILEM
ncbi:MAG: PadR family transcriptional regulator [Thermoproteota archaeon]|nr:PadR family transcriptional regulator [Thermoproteota archaeon]